MRAEAPPRRRDTAAFVRRLEACVVERTEGHPRVAVAYSGGLASTLLALVARKRYELECIVAGTADSADVHAASEVTRYLDLRITTAVLDASGARRIVSRAKANGLQLSMRTIAMVLPVLTVRERTSGEAVLTGFGIGRSDPRILDSLRRLGIHSPMAEASQWEPVPRETLRAAAISLGLPEAWARVPHRDPAEGAGVTALLEGLDSKAGSREAGPSKS